MLTCNALIEKKCIIAQRKNISSMPVCMCMLAWPRVFPIFTHLSRLNSRQRMRTGEISKQPKHIQQQIKTFIDMLRALVISNSLLIP
jgi:hypothetical protein